MAQQVPADPFLHFMERFRFIMVRRLQGIVTNDLILEFVDKIIWHALQENKEDYSYIVLRAIFESMGISQAQKHRLIQHAGWANAMSFQHGNFVPPHDQFIVCSNPWNARQEPFNGPVWVKNFTRPCAIRQENVQRDLGYLIKTVPQLNNSLLEMESLKLSLSAETFMCTGK